MRCRARATADGVKGYGGQQRRLFLWRPRPSWCATPAVRAGTRPGLRTAADVRPCSRTLPAQGNQFTYMGRRFSEMILASQKQVLASGNQMPLELFEKLFLRYGVNYGLSIGAHTRPAG